MSRSWRNHATREENAKEAKESGTESDLIRRAPLDYDGAFKFWMRVVDAGFARDKAPQCALAHYRVGTLLAWKASNADFGLREKLETLETALTYLDVAVRYRPNQTLEARAGLQKGIVLVDLWAAFREASAAAGALSAAGGSGGGASTKAWRERAARAEECLLRAMDSFETSLAGLRLQRPLAGERARAHVGLAHCFLVRRAGDEAEDRDSAAHHLGDAVACWEERIAALPTEDGPAVGEATAAVAVAANSASSGCMPVPLLSPSMCPALLHALDDENEPPQLAQPASPGRRGARNKHEAQAKITGGASGSGAVVSRREAAASSRVRLLLALARVAVAQALHWKRRGRSAGGATENGDDPAEWALQARAALEAAAAPGLSESAELQLLLARVTYLGFPAAAAGENRPLGDVSRPTKTASASEVPRSEVCLDILLAAAAESGAQKVAVGPVSAELNYQIGRLTFVRAQVTAAESFKGADNGVDSHRSGNGRGCDSSTSSKALLLQLEVAHRHLRAALDACRVALAELRGKPSSPASSKDPLLMGAADDASGEVALLLARKLVVTAELAKCQLFHGDVLAAAPPLFQNGSATTAEDAAAAAGASKREWEAAVALLTTVNASTPPSRLPVAWLSAASLRAAGLWRIGRDSEAAALCSVAATFVPVLALQLHDWSRLAASAASLNGSDHSGGVRSRAASGASAASAKGAAFVGTPQDGNDYGGGCGLSGAALNLFAIGLECCRQLCLHDRPARWGPDHWVWLGRGPSTTQLANARKRRSVAHALLSPGTARATYLRGSAGAAPGSPLAAPSPSPAAVAAAAASDAGGMTLEEYLGVKGGDAQAEAAAGTGAETASATSDAGKIDKTTASGVPVLRLAATRSGFRSSVGAGGIKSGRPDSRGSSANLLLGAVPLAPAHIAAPSAPVPLWLVRMQAALAQGTAWAPVRNRRAPFSSGGFSGHGRAWPALAGTAAAAAAPREREGAAIALAALASKPFLSDVCSPEKAHEMFDAHPAALRILGLWHRAGQSQMLELLARGGIASGPRWRRAEEGLGPQQRREGANRAASVRGELERMRRELGRPSLLSLPQSTFETRPIARQAWETPVVPAHNELIDALQGFDLWLRVNVALRDPALPLLVGGQAAPPDAVDAALEAGRTATAGADAATAAAAEAAGAAAALGCCNVEALAELIDPWEVLLSWVGGANVIYSGGDAGLEVDDSLYVIMVYRERKAKAMPQDAAAAAAAAAAARAAEEAAAAAAAAAGAGKAAKGPTLTRILANTVATRGNRKVAGAQVITRKGLVAAAADDEPPAAASSSRPAVPPLPSSSVDAAGPDSSRYGHGAPHPVHCAEDADNFEPGALCVRVLGGGGKRSSALRRATTALAAALRNSSAVKRDALCPKALQGVASALGLAEVIAAVPEHARELVLVVAPGDPLESVPFHALPLDEVPSPPNTAAPEAHFRPGTSGGGGGGVDGGGVLRVADRFAVRCCSSLQLLEVCDRQALVNVLATPWYLNGCLVVEDPLRTENASSDSAAESCAVRASWSSDADDFSVLAGRNATRGALVGTAGGGGAVVKPHQARCLHFCSRASYGPVPGVVLCAGGDASNSALNNASPKAQKVQQRQHMSHENGSSLREKAKQNHGDLLSGSDIVALLHLRNCGLVVLSRGGRLRDVAPPTGATSAAVAAAAASTLGIVEAFVTAGVHTVIWRLWAEDDSSSSADAVLFLRFYAELREATMAGERRPVAVALRAAQLFLRRASLDELHNYVHGCRTLQKSAKKAICDGFAALAHDIALRNPGVAAGGAPFADAVFYWASFVASGACAPVHSLQSLHHQKPSQAAAAAMGATGASAKEEEDEEEGGWQHHRRDNGHGHSHHHSSRSGSHHRHHSHKHHTHRHRHESRHKRSSDDSDGSEHSLGSLGSLESGVNSGRRGSFGSKESDDSRSVGSSPGKVRGASAAAGDDKEREGGEGSATDQSIEERDVGGGVRGGASGEQRGVTLAGKRSAALGAAIGAARKLRARAKYEEEEEGGEGAGAGTGPRGTKPASTVCAVC